jgi:hypothetical protein
MVALTVFDARPFETEKCLKEYCLACCAEAVPAKSKRKIALQTNRIKAVPISESKCNTQSREIATFHSSIKAIHACECAFHLSIGFFPSGTGISAHSFENPIHAEQHSLPGFFIAILRGHSINGLLTKTTNA